MDPQPTARVQIGTDPTFWVVPASQDAIAGQLQQAAGPVDLPVADPLNGLLVLSALAAGWVTVLPGAPDTGGTHPTGTASPRGTHPTGDRAQTAAAVYLPSLTAATPSTPGHLLATGTEVATTAEDIRAAMTNGTRLTLQLNADSGGGLLVLNGAALAFVVLVLATV
ncbi:MAG: hypothetical protein JO037_03840 [Actinobacteria bacterium]|nr:hypothetical protein [Actinomycetota bacterium]